MSAPLLLRIFRSAAIRLRRLAEHTDRRRIELECAYRGVPDAAGIRTYTTRGELETLYRLAAELPPGATIVELGSYLGASTCFLAAGAAVNGARVVAIDMWKNETMPDGLRDTFADFQRNISGVANRVRILRKRTAEITAEDVQPPVHLAFIDADHSYEATKADAAVMAPYLVPQGLMVFHDATTFAGVGQAVGELLASGEWVLVGRQESLVWIRRATWARWPLVDP
jgi:predicted O-methyltransferase YrrM